MRTSVALAAFKVKSWWLLWTLLVSSGRRPSKAAATTTTAGAAAFAPPAILRNKRIVPQQQLTSPRSRLHAKKPQRLEENVDGVVYVNDRCINCAACSAFAPATFRRSSTDAAHVVYQQPSSSAEVEEARAALAACPVAAIRIETLAERRHRASSEAERVAVQEHWSADDERLVEQMSLRRPKKHKDTSSSAHQHPPFPKPFLGDMEDVYWLGHHNDRSFGAVPYLLRATKKGRDDVDDDEEFVWIMVDTPRYGPSAVAAVESLTGPAGPDYLFLTHVDDTADHDKWAEHYDGLRRIFHAGDLGRHNWLNDHSLEDVEVLLREESTSQEARTDEDEEGVHLTAYNLDGEMLSKDWSQDNENGDEVVILHTPGHSPGSITLYRRPSFENDGTSKSHKKIKPGILFTGDTYAWTTRNGGQMSGFPRYGNNLQTQAKTLEEMSKLDWDVIAAGHGHARDYRKPRMGASLSENVGDEEKEAEKKMRQLEEMQQAKEELLSYSK